MEDNWKLLIVVDCDHSCIRDSSKSVEEINLPPYLPRAGEGFYMSLDTQEKFNNIIKECNDKQRCEDCPLMIIDDRWLVDFVLHDARDKTITIYLEV